MVSSTLILREYNGVGIPQRPDGYMNATKMCQAGGKLLGDWRRLKWVNEYLAATQRSMGIPIDQLVIVVDDGPNDLRGTWIHPRLASRLAQWISPEFAVIVDGWVIDIFEGRQPVVQQPQPVALPTPQERLNVIRLGMDLLDRLGGMDDRTCLALKDLTRNILLEDKLKQPALPSGERLEWPVSDRLLHLGYKRADSDTLKAIGQVASKLYRNRHGKKPPKREQFVDGTTRPVNCYGSADLDILDEAITQVMGKVAEAS